jgi:hypothetical protein
MARLKSSYRPKAYATGGGIPLDVRLGYQPLDVQVDTPAANVAADAATEQMLEAVSLTDEASNAFQHQIDDLRKAERIQKERNEVAAFLRANPDMVKHPEITGQAEIEAQKQGHQYGSPAFYEAVRDNFTRMTDPEEVSARYLEKMAELGEDVSEPAAEDYEPPSTPSRGHMVSAPVSRETQANGAYDSYGDRRGKITLSIQQREAARIAGVDEKTYAEQLLVLRQRKSEGDYGGSL